MMDTDPVPDQARQRFAEPRGEPEPAECLRYRVLFGAAGKIQAGQRLRPLQRGGLGEMDDIDRRLMRADQFLERFGDRRPSVGEGQRHRAFGTGHHGGTATGAAFQIGGEEIHLTEGGRHEQELGSGQFQQRHLPRPAPARVGVEMELVHHHLAHLGIGAFP